VQSLRASGSDAIVTKKTPVDGPVRVRFAPSPTGSLHVGGARTALYNYLLAKQTKGKFVIRVEDTDTARSTRESENGIMEDLRWLGLEANEGPGTESKYGPYRQSERTHIYKDMADRLVQAGLAYPCFCTDQELEAMRQRAEEEGRPPHYDGTWRDADPDEIAKMKEQGVPYTIRFRVPSGKRVTVNDHVRGEVSWDAGSAVGDFIILRSSGMPVYNFCVAVDDALMEITHVIRAEEHLSNTLRQLLILDGLGYPAPEYAHCSLILGTDRSKLSKRHGATSVGQFREQGYLPQALNNYLALLGWNEGTGTEKEIYTMDELVSSFSLDRVGSSGAVFDLQKLNWVNSQHLKAQDPALILEQLGRQLDKAGIGGNEGTGGFRELAVDMVREPLQLAHEAPGLVSALLEHPLDDTISSGEASELLEDGFVDVARAVVEAHDSGALPTGDGRDGAEFESAWKGWVKNVGKSLGRKGKRLFHPIRLALTGRMSGPDVGQQVRLLSLAVKEGVPCVCLDDRIGKLREWLLSTGSTSVESGQEAVAAQSV